jgi:hypothetical protein
MLQETANGRVPAPMPTRWAAAFAIDIFNCDLHRRGKTQGPILSVAEIGKKVKWAARRAYRMHARLKQARSASRFLAYSGGRPREYSPAALAKVDQALHDRKHGEQDITTREIHQNTGVSLWTVRKRRTQLKLGLSRHQLAAQAAAGGRRELVFSSGQQARGNPVPRGAQAWVVRRRY